MTEPRYQAEHIHTLLSGFLADIHGLTFPAVIQLPGGVLPDDCIDACTQKSGRDIELYTCEHSIYNVLHPFLGFARQVPSPTVAFLPRLRPTIAAILAKHRQIPDGEEAIPGEWAFEEQRIINGFLQLTHEYLGNRILIIQNAQFLSPASLAIMHHLASSSTPGEGLPRIILVTNGSTMEENEALWNRITELVDEHRALLQVPHSIPEVIRPPSIGFDSHAAFNQAHHALELHADTEAAYIFMQLLLEHENGTRSLPANLQLRARLHLGRLAYFTQNWDECIHQLQHLAALAQNQEDHAALAGAYWRMGISFLHQGDLEEADRLAHQAAGVAERANLPADKFYADYLYFQIEDQRRFQSIPEFESFFTALLERAEGLGFLNTYACIATNPFGLYSAYSQRIEDLHTRGLRIAEELENDWRQAEAYQTLGMAHAVTGNYADTLAEYQTSYHIRERLGDPVALAGAANGMGFYFLLTGDYRSAMERFSRAMKNLRETTEYHEIAMTLFNMALCSTLARDFCTASGLLHHCSQLLHILGRSNMAFHSRYGLLSLHGLCLAASGDQRKARRMLNSIAMYNSTAYEGKNEEFFWNHLLHALLTPPDDTAALTRHLNAAEDYLFRTNDRIDYMAPFYYRLKADIIDHASSIELARQEAEQRDNLYYRELLSGTQPSPPDAALHDLGWILLSARMQKHTVHLHQRVEEIRFLSELQSLFNQYTSIEALVEAAVERIYSSFPFSAVYYHTVNPEMDIQLLSFRSRDEQASPHAGAVVRYALQQPDSKIVHKQDGSPALSLHIGDPPDMLGHILCIPENPAYLERVESLQVLTIAAQQLHTAVERMNQQSTILAQWQELKRKNVLLEQLSTTDQLTGLGNRNALYKTLSKETQRMRRYGIDSAPCSLMFVDLDNFKEINDTLGHAAGDLVLSRTAEIIRIELRDTDSAFRYGGDEFVVLLPETPPDGAQRVADRITAEIATRNSFQQELTSHSGSATPVSLSCPLTLSIGITHIDQISGDFNPETMLDQADHALYTAKRSGKNRSVIYQIPPEE